MRLVNTRTGETIAHIESNHRMTVEEACELLDIKIMQTQEDYENGDGYDIEELDLVEEDDDF